MGGWVGGRSLIGWLAGWWAGWVGARSLAGWLAGWAGGLARWLASDGMTAAWGLLPATDFKDGKLNGDGCRPISKQALRLTPACYPSSGSLAVIWVQAPEWGKH